MRGNSRGNSQSVFVWCKHGLSLCFYISQMYTHIYNCSKSGASVGTRTAIPDIEPRTRLPRKPRRRSRLLAVVGLVIASNFRHCFLAHIEVAQQCNGVRCGECNGDSMCSAVHLHRQALLSVSRGDHVFSNACVVIVFEVAANSRNDVGSCQRTSTCLTCLNASERLLLCSACCSL